MPESRVTIRTARPDELAAVARFMARVIATDDSYISHGEIQTGLSRDGAHWDAELEAMFVEDLASPDPERSVLVADVGGTLADAAIILWQSTPRVSFMVIEDVAVDPAMRSLGIGASLIAFAEREGAERGMDWAFLESGLRNEDAHRFFARRGFRAISKVFSKRL